MIRRPPRSTLSSSSAASDVYKRQINAEYGGEPSITMEQAMHPFVQKIRPVANAIKALTIALGPPSTKLYHKAEQGWALLQPYHPNELIPLLLGLVLCFFGGAYVTTITAFEAFRVVAYADVSASLRTLWDQYKTGLAAAEKDAPAVKDAADETKVFTHKLTVAVKACDPDTVNHALLHLQAGLMAVVAVLRIKFAQTITFGSSMGSQIEERLSTGWFPQQLELAIPPEFHKWVPSIITYGCRVLGIAAAWTVQRALFAFHTSVKGGRMIARGGLRYAGKLKGFDAGLYEDSPNLLYLEATLAAIGFYAQFVRGFSAVGWVGVVLFPVFMPLNIIEFTIGLIIGRAA
eukprot:TRINITY_DN3178_c0_g1_i2.p1 TRINITY_DN3178_c0_g1~~TRINITY_DN3178_c0_g1_i2.p1  ORF type:complete len:347 (-),score=93.79 TRINITY_DN3178_c0_g1_i2:38-1078(-)